ncbi:hypothetical protein KHQ81_09775 [Mycoplasmatota bacterium]|nr:hypothetical protein KHQ81_09775 [Mycoplasmatota bacterium]
MKKLGLFIGLLLFTFIISINVSADDSLDNLLIEGLDQIQTEYEAGINPNSINFVNGLSLYSNSGTLAPDKLLVDYLNVDFDRVGDYEVYYYVIFVIDDQEVRFDIATLPIKIVDHTKPVLRGVKPIYVKQNTNQTIDYLDGVWASDNDKSSPLDIKVFNHAVDLTKVGIYNISYYAVDKSGNESLASTSLVVQNERIDVNKPEITVNKSEFNIKSNEQNAEIIYMNSVAASDGEVDLTDFVQYDDSGVDYQTIGQYEVVFMVFDDDGNFTKEVVPVNIVEDNDPPYFINLDDTYDLTINTYDLKNGIIANDDVCGDMSNQIKVTIGTDFDSNKEGYYNVVYSVSDLNGNETSKTVIVHVYDNLAPVITVTSSSLYLKLNDNLDIDDKISVTDNVDSFVNYVLLDNNLDATKVGTYLIEVSATDAHGNEAIKKITVYVYDPESKELYENPIVLGSLVAIGVSAVVTFIGYSISKKNRKKRRRR